MHLHRQFSRAALVAVTGLCLSVNAFAADCDDDRNWLVDPGFELQTPPSMGGWEAVPAFSDALNGGYARGGRYSLALTGQAAPAQSVRAAPGSRWRMTGYGMHPFPMDGSPGPAFGVLQVTFTDANGGDLGTVETIGNQYPAKTSAAIAAGTSERGWILLDTGIATAPAKTAFIKVFALFLDFTYSSGRQSVYFDDLRLKKVCSSQDEQR
jgi:hypothetical protein